MQLYKVTDTDGNNSYFETEAEALGEAGDDSTVVAGTWTEGEPDEVDEFEAEEDDEPDSDDGTDEDDE